MKMQTIVGIFIFISRENFMLRWVEHKKCFITSGPDLFGEDGHVLCVLWLCYRMVHLRGLNTPGSFSTIFARKTTLVTLFASLHTSLWLQTSLPSKEKMHPNQTYSCSLVKHSYFSSTKIKLKISLGSFLDYLMMVTKYIFWLIDIHTPEPP